MAEFTVGNFFRYYAAQPGKAPVKERTKAKLWAFGVGIATLGVVPLAVKVISKIRWKTFDDFDFAQYNKTQKVAGQRFGRSDWVNQDATQPVAEVIGTYNISSVKEKVLEFENMLRQHQSLLDQTPVKKERQKDSRFQFKQKFYNQLKQTVKELNNLQIRGSKKHVEIDAPLVRAEEIKAAYFKEIGRRQFEIEKERAGVNDVV